MLDKLPADIWHDKTKTFCDPVCGTGKFLLGIKDRLMEGLKNEIPSNEDREKWIIENMIYGYDINPNKIATSKKFIGNNKNFNYNLETKDTLKDEI